MQGGFALELLVDSQVVSARVSDGIGFGWLTLFDVPTAGLVRSVWATAPVEVVGERCKSVLRWWGEKLGCSESFTVLEQWLTGSVFDSVQLRCLMDDRVNDQVVEELRGDFAEALRCVSAMEITEATVDGFLLAAQMSGIEFDDEDDMMLPGPAALVGVVHT